MTPADFQTTYLPYASTVEAGTGIWRSALLSQWAVETAWGSQLVGCNLGNIRCSPTTFCEYGSLGEFCVACVATWHNGNYSGVLSIAPHATPQETMVAIGQSPWDAGHYNNGGGPGSSLLAFYKELPMANTVGDLDQKWLTDVNARQESFLGTGGSDTAPITISEVYSAIKAIGTPPASDLQPVLDALTKLQADVDAIKADVDAIKAKTDRDLV